MTFLQNLFFFFFSNQPHFSSQGFQAPLLSYSSLPCLVACFFFFNAKSKEGFSPFFQRERALSTHSPSHPLSPSLPLSKVPSAIKRVCECVCVCACVCVFQCLRLAAEHCHEMDTARYCKPHCLSVSMFEHVCLCL